MSAAPSPLNGAGRAPAPPRAVKTRRLEDSNVRSEEVREILEATPTRLLQQGIVVVVLAAVFGLFLTWWIRWPEVVDGKVIVTSKDPPVPVAARADGRIERLYVHEGDRVDRGAMLALLESTAHGEHVLALRDALQRFERTLDSPGPRSTDEISPEWELGDLRGAVTELVQSVEDERAFAALPGYDLRLRAFARELADHGSLDETLRQEQALLARSVALLEEQVARDQALADRGGLGRMAQDEIARRLVDERARLQELEATALRNRLERLGSERASVELSQTRAERARALDRGVREALRKLQGLIADWLYKFALRAPTTGRVSFFDVWSEDQRVKSGDEVLFVVPETLELVGRTTLAQAGAGRVRRGQRVRIRFDSYPAAQFGIVAATVKDISATARKNELVATLELPEGLKTSYGRELSFKQGMAGSASIITDDVRLATRMLGPLRHALLEGPAAGSDAP